MLLDARVYNVFKTRFYKKPIFLTLYGIKYQITLPSRQQQHENMHKTRVFYTIFTHKITAVHTLQILYS